VNDQQGTAGLSDQDRRSLTRLRMHWECYYDIRFEHGAWVAERLSDSGGILTAAGPGELRERLREDHAARSVARDERAGRAAEGGSL
jgi:hypothetical protein